MKLLRQLRSTFGVLARARRNRVDLWRALVRRPQILLGTVCFETGILSSARVDGRRKILAELMTVIAWENKRARLNQGLGVRPSGFSDGEFCVLPEATELSPAS